MALNAAILAGIVLMGVRWARRKYAEIKPALFSEAEMWMGGAIGRFMQNLSEQAAEEGVEGSSPGSGTIKLGGFQIDVGTIREILPIIPQILQLAQMFGVVKGGGGGTVNPFLKALEP